MTARLREAFRQLADEADEYNVVDRALAHEERRRSRLLAAASGLAVLLLLTATLGHQGFRSSALEPAGPANGPTMPDRVPSASWLTASVADHPSGRAIAVLNHNWGALGGLFEDFSQTVTLTTDGDTYRALTDDCYHYLLSPDGAQVACVGPGNALTRTDLRTGRSRRYPVRGDGGQVTLHGYSPDGRTVAWGINPGRVVVATDGLQLMDLATGKSVGITDQRVTAASFSPDGRRIAVGVTSDSPTDTSQRVLILDRTGKELTHLDVRGFLAGPNAWSPDGRLLATVEDVPIGEDGVWKPSTVRAYPVDRADTEGAVRPIQTRLRSVAGWRSGTELMLVEPTDEADGSLGPNELVVRSLDTSGRKVLATLPLETGVDSMATGLLGELQPRHAGPADNGPWPGWFIGALAFAVGLVAGPIGLVWWRRRSRRRRPAV